MNYFLPQSRHSFLSQNTSTPLDATTSLQKLREILKNQNESDDKPSSTSRKYTLYVVYSCWITRYATQ